MASLWQQQLTFVCVLACGVVPRSSRLDQSADRVAGEGKAFFCWWMRHSDLSEEPVFTVINRRKGCGRSQCCKRGVALDCVSSLEWPPRLWSFSDWPRLASDCSSLHLRVRRAERDKRRKGTYRGLHADVLLLDVLNMDHPSTPELIMYATWEALLFCSTV